MMPQQGRLFLGRGSIGGAGPLKIPMIIQGSTVSTLRPFACEKATRLGRLISKIDFGRSFQEGFGVQEAREMLFFLFDLNFP